MFYRPRHFNRNPARNSLQSRAIYLGSFISTDTAPAPVGSVVTGNAPPLNYDFIGDAYPPEARPFVLLASLRSAFLNTHPAIVRDRFNQEIANILNPPSLAHFYQEQESAHPTTLVTYTSPSAASSLDTCPSYRSGSSNPQQFMDDRLKRDMSIDKAEILMSTVSVSTRARYRDGWTDWHDFCDGVQIFSRLGPSKDGWGGIVSDFLTWEHRIMGVCYSGMVARYSSIRFAHSVEGCG